ncbi:MAG: protein kinase domain-containing protein, partial [Bacteroidota bacterium]
MNLLNRRIEKYNFIKTLGSGGMATVYLAEDTKFSTNVAIKVLNKDLANNDNIRKRFLAEAKNMFRMQHPN